MINYLPSLSKGFDLPVTDFEDLHKEHVRPLIELNDRVNFLTATETKINATRIVVAGDQSHGKTSLLEALSGVDLPRGEGIVTRVPLILQLRGVKDGETESATIMASPGANNDIEEAIDIRQISDKIKETTDRIAGTGKDVQNKPITVKIFRKNQDDLTLVDLPGITRVALEDQAGGNNQELEKRIMGMCREYMTPEESILLNVVNAMVDFTTSASLALSRELDPKGTRTMLCITKVDQHTETESFHPKVMKAITTINLNPEHVFCVRNRSERENKQGLSLKAVRREEMDLLHSITKNNQPTVTYGLGVCSLSKALVKRQCQEIKSTLPATFSNIKRLEGKLEAEYRDLGEPLETVGLCRGRIIQLIDAFTARLQDDISGRISMDDSSNATSCQGKSFELSYTVSDLKAALADSGDLSKYSERHCVGECSFRTKLELKKKDGEDSSKLGMYLQVQRLVDEIETVEVVCEFAVEGEIGTKRKLEHSFDFSRVKNDTWGFDNLMTIDPEGVKRMSEITVTASVFVAKVTMKDKSSMPKRQNSLLCSRLADLQDTFASNIDKLCSNGYIFSDEFRKFLAQEASASRGGTGLPGRTPGTVATKVLRTMGGRLSDPIESFREKVHEECLESLEPILEEHVNHEVVPRLHTLILEETRGLLDKRLGELEGFHDKFLEWENDIATANDYYMDTVQSIRGHLLKDNVHPPPAYLGNLTRARFKRMSNEEQKLVDEQIEIFAYWKVLKKRLVDYVILSTRSELAMKPLGRELKPLLLDRVFSHHNDDRLIKLVAPKDSIVKKRAALKERLANLQQAMTDIKNFRQNYVEDAVEMDDESC